MRDISRREGLALGLLGGLVALPGRAEAQAMASDVASAPAGGFVHESEDGIAAWNNVHHGKGSMGVKRYRFGGAPRPANFVVYDIPPGASEGVHTHLRDNSNGLGVFDEFYYIVEGEGQMEIGETRVPVRAGDHVFTPIGIPHGIENTAASGHLKVFLTFIQREPQAPSDGA
jgi:quercetin dioxygenase-like cupin family protein